LSLTSFSLFFLAFVNVFAYVHHPANWRIGVGSHFYQIESGFLGIQQGFLDRYNALVGTVSPDQAYLWGSDLCVTTKIYRAYVPLLFLV
jgi:hypothetical protein